MGNKYFMNLNNNGVCLVQYWQLRTKRKTSGKRNNKSTLTSTKPIIQDLYAFRKRGIHVSLSLASRQQFRPIAVGCGMILRISSKRFRGLAKRSDSSPHYVGRNACIWPLHGSRWPRQWSQDKCHYHIWHHCPMTFLPSHMMSFVACTCCSSVGTLMLGWTSNSNLCVLWHAHSSICLVEQRQLTSL